MRVRKLTWLMKPTMASPKFVGQAGQEVGEDVGDRLLQPVAEISEPAQGPEDTATSAATIASWLRHGEGRSGERHGNRRDNQHRV